jgi:hypothetical protein
VTANKMLRNVSELKGGEDIKDWGTLSSSIPATYIVSAVKSR